HGLRQDEAAQLVLLGLLAGQQVLPGEPAVLSGERRLGGLVDRREGGIDALGVDAALRRALRGKVEGIEHAAQARISGERAYQRLRRDDLVGEVLHVLLGEKKQAILLEEIAAIWAAHALEQILLAG